MILKEVDVHFSLVCLYHQLVCQWNTCYSYRYEVVLFENSWMNYKGIFSRMKESFALKFLPPLQASWKFPPSSFSLIQLATDNYPSVTIHCVVWFLLWLCSGNWLSRVHLITKHAEHQRRPNLKPLKRDENSVLFEKMRSFDNSFEYHKSNSNLILGI